MDEDHRLHPGRDAGESVGTPNDAVRQGAPWLPPVAESDTPATRRSSLASSRLFGGLPMPELDALAARLVFRVFPAGDVAIHEGEPADRCYLVVSGKALVSVRDQVGEDVEVATLGPADTFGETALVSGT